MITLNFSVDDQLLTRTDENTVAANSHLVHTCEFVFSSEWDNRGKVATFKKRDLMLSVILDDDACTIPPEILQSENKIDVFELSVCGADGNSTITSTVVKVPILAGTWDPFTEEITPTLFEQIMQKIDEVEKGEVSPELIYEAVSEYMEAHPLEPIIADDVAAYFVAHAEELKGPKGDTGATPSITATAEVNNAVGTPSVTVTKTGTPEAPNLNFAFQNLKGSKGDTGATPTISAAATVDNTTGTPAVNVSKTGTDAAPEFTFAFSGLKGAKGDPGTPGASYDDTEIRAEINDVWKVQGKLGAKNLLKYPYFRTHNNPTNDGVDIHANADGTVTLNGTATKYSSIDIHGSGEPLELAVILQPGRYIFSDGLEAIAANANIGIVYSIRSQPGYESYSTPVVTTKYAREYAFEVTQEMTEHMMDGSWVLQARVFCENGTVCDNVIVKPMIRYAEDNSSEWEPYAKSNYELSELMKGVAVQKPFLGKKILSLGDSYTFLNYYGPYLAKVTGATQRGRGQNGGVLMSFCADTYTGPNGVATPETFDATLLNDYDVVTIMGGTNDYGHGNATLGTMADQAGDNTIYGSVKYLIDKILTIKPSIKIFFCTQPYRLQYSTETAPGGYEANSNGLTMESIAGAIKECCAHYGIPCFDFYSCSNWNPWTVKKVNGTLVDNIYTYDGLHPKDGAGNGADLLGTAFGSFINQHAE